MVNEFEIIIFLGQIWWYTRKGEGFWRKKRKTKLRQRGGIETIVRLETDLTYCYL